MEKVYGSSKWWEVKDWGESVSELMIVKKHSYKKLYTVLCYVYWTVHQLTSWIIWTEVMSLYMKVFLLLNMFRMLLHSSSGTGDCMYVHCSVPVCTGAPTCIRIPPYSSRTAPIYQYTPKQSSTHTYSRQLLRMNVITFETCWAIKTFIKWHQVGSIYSTLLSRVGVFTFCTCYKILICLVCIVASFKLSCV